MLKCGQRKLLALVDPDRWDYRRLEELLSKLEESSMFEGILVGGSLIMKDGFHSKVAFIKRRTNKPVICFPGSSYQINTLFDGYLLPFPMNTFDASRFWNNLMDVANLLVSRNVMVFSYVLLGNHNTSAHFVSRSFPLQPKEDVLLTIANVTKIMKFDGIYLEAGSGSATTVDIHSIHYLRKHYDGIIIVGGGVRDIRTAQSFFESGADYVVVGNALEQKEVFL